MHGISSFALLVLLTLMGCRQNAVDEAPLFRLVTPQRSGVDFANVITENDSFNVLSYEYIYNGSGVGVGDFNLDGLPDLFFAGNMVSSRLYLNQGDFRFQDVTHAAGVTTDAWCTGVAIGDINGDGWPDIHVATAHDTDLGPAANYFFINKTQQAGGAVVFENLASQMGLADDAYSVQVAFLDFDKDQDLDVFLINNSMENYPRNRPFGQKTDGSGKSTDRLYENVGEDSMGVPIFKDVYRHAGILIEGWSLSVKVMDFNDDAYPDIYVANDFLANDLLYINQRDGTFTNQITDYFKHQSHNSMGMDAADINNDGASDLVILDMLPEDNLRRKTMFDHIPFDRFNESLRQGYQPQFVRNVLQARGPDDTFSEIGYFAGIAATDWSWSPLLADFDNDGLRDLYVTNGYKKDITDQDFINYNQEVGAFSSAEKRQREIVRRLNEMEGVKKSNRLFINQGQFVFKDETSTSGLELASYSNGAAYVDLDLDGDLDLVANNMNDPALILENLLPADRHHFRLKLLPDAQAYGARVRLYANGLTQYAEYYPQLGYLSNVEPLLHFGLDTLQTIDSLLILWPDQRTYRAENLPADQLLEIDARRNEGEWQAAGPRQGDAPKAAMVPTELMRYPHEESSFNDFKTWPLRFRGHGKPGPVLAGGDVNGDGLWDVFLGGAARRNGRILLQTPGGDFQEVPLNDSLGRMCEDSGATLFDADGDGDLDLYCVSGSSEFYARPELYQDRFYENVGGGIFTHRPNKLPEIREAGSCVVPLDYDGDGDLDLFVGGRLDATRYPFAPRSFLLQNNGNSFQDVTENVAPALVRPGLVTDAKAADFNADGRTDLLVVGEWMPLQIFYNRDGQLAVDQHDNGLGRTNGWWNCAEAGDFDGDGDVDFLAGNWGLNNPFTASPSAPISIYARDYDGNGSIEALMTHFNQGVEYIFHPRGTLTSQLPGIKGMFQSFRSYGLAPFSEMFPEADFSDSEVFRAYQLASVYVENLGDGRFSVRELPSPLQWSPIFAFSATDVNGDGMQDVLAVGNYKDVEVLSGWYDAGNGYCLINKGKGQFNVMSQLASGFSVPGEGRSMVAIPYSRGGMLYVVGVQADGVKTFWRREREELLD